MARKITDLDAARALKRLGLPLDTEIEERTFSQNYSQHWTALVKRYSGFLGTAERYGKNPNALNWQRLRRALNGLRNEIGRCMGFVEDVHNDATERWLMHHFLGHHAEPFLHFWERIVADLKAGREVRFNVSSMPRWFDDED